MKGSSEILKVVFIYCLCGVPKLASSVQINFIKVPAAVKNDSGNPIILDCNYSVRPDDTELVVKWFLDNKQVYHWIPPHKPQSSGVLKNRIDLSHKASDDPQSVYRAMKILNPTTDIAGEYKCLVSTFADEDFSIKNMIVFEPERSFVILKDDHDQQSVNFTCYANDIYPAPKLILYKDGSDEFYKKILLPILEWNTSKHPNGRFSVFVIANVLLDSLNPGTLVHCELRIPGTHYVKKRSLLYYPSDLISAAPDVKRRMIQNSLFTIGCSNAKTNDNGDMKVVVASVGQVMYRHSGRIQSNARIRKPSNSETPLIPAYTDILITQSDVFY